MSIFFWVGAKSGRIHHVVEVQPEEVDGERLHSTYGDERPALCGARPLQWYQSRMRAIPGEPHPALVHQPSWECKRCRAELDKRMAS